MWKSMRFCQEAYCMIFFSFKLPPHLHLAFMSNYFNVFFLKKNNVRGTNYFTKKFTKCLCGK